MAEGKPYSDEDMREVSDNPEWTADDFRKAKPFAEVFPDLAATIGPDREPRLPEKVAVNLHLDRDLVDALQAGGDGWEERTNGMLRAAVGMSQRKSAESQA